MSDTTTESIPTHQPGDFTEPATHLSLPPHYEPPMLEPRADEPTAPGSAPSSGPRSP